MAWVVRGAAAMVCLACGCTGGAAGPSGKPAVHPSTSAKPALAQGSATPAIRARSDRSADAESTTLLLPTAGVDHQVRMLRKSVALYRQFIERAEGQPEMQDAVRRSRERIEDAEKTLEFLLGESPPED